MYSPYESGGGGGRKPSRMERAIELAKVMLRNARALAEIKEMNIQEKEWVVIRQAVKKANKKK